MSVSTSTRGLAEGPGPCLQLTAAIRSKTLTFFHQAPLDTGRCVWEVRKMNQTILKRLEFDMAAMQITRLMKRNDQCCVGDVYRKGRKFLVMNNKGFMKMVAYKQILKNDVYSFYQYQYLYLSIYVCMSKFIVSF